MTSVHELGQLYVGECVRRGPAGFRGKLKRMEFERVLTTFLEFFDRENIRYAIVGGLAVHAYGRLRSTKEVDFAVDLANRQRVIAFAESLGYDTLLTSRAFSNHAHADAAWGRVDFMYFDPATAAKVFAGSRPQQIMANITATVASPEHVAMMKALSMKNHPHRVLYEGHDVQVLMSAPGVDIESVRDYYRTHGLLELFDAIVKKS